MNLKTKTQIKLKTFVFEYFTNRPHKGAILIFLIILAATPTLNLLWFGTHCDYINLKGNPNIDWDLEVGSSSSHTDPISWEDDTPQSGYPAHSSVRYLFTAVTTWYELGIPMVDIYRVAFFKPIEYHGIVCDLDYENSLAIKTGNLAKSTAKYIFWIYILICLYENIKAYHNYKTGQELFEHREYGSERTYEKYYKPITPNDYLEWCIPAVFTGTLLKLIITISWWAVESLFMF